MERKKAFTLVELLVVISIIALLMSILMPALGRARSQAKDIVCRARLSQWGLAWKMYTDDNDGSFTRNWAWIGPLYPYIRKTEMMLCPMATRPLAGAGGWRGRKVDYAFAAYVEDAGPLGDILASYGMNMWLAHTTGGTRRDEWLWKRADVKGPSEIPLLFDGRSCTPYHTDMPPEYEGQMYLDAGTNRHEIRNACINRHNGGINMLFVDFGARRVGLKELWELKWRREWFTLPDGTPHYYPPVWPDWMKKFKDYR